MIFFRFQGMLSPPQPHHHAAATKDDIWDIREVPASSVRRLPEAGDEMGKTLEVFRDGKNILFLGFDCKPDAWFWSYGIRNKVWMWALFFGRLCNFGLVYLVSPTCLLPYWYINPICLSFKGFVASWHQLLDGQKNKNPQDHRHPDGWKKKIHLQ